MNVPDMAGFREAQRRLVESLGTDVVFMVPGTTAYASGAYVNDDGIPLDPTIPASSTVGASGITTRATIIRSAATAANAGIATVVGDVPEGKLWLRIPEGTYSAAILDAATVLVDGETYEVQRFTKGSLGNEVDRLYVECELRS